MLCVCGLLEFGRVCRCVAAIVEFWSLVLFKSSYSFGSRINIVGLVGLVVVK